MSTIADDQRRAADWADDCCDRDLARRLRTHAALIEKIEAQMREHPNRERPECHRWADALKTGELK